MGLLSREQIFAAADRGKTIDVEVPEWGGTVRVALMTGAERDRFEVEYSRHTEGKSVHGVRAWLAAHTIVDEQGNRVFKAADVAELGRRSAAALDRVWAVAAALNRITNRDVEELEGNSPSGQSDDSGSSSQG